MKKSILLAGLLYITIIINVSCGKTINQDSQKANILNNADGDLNIMDQNEITQRLSELKAEMTINEVILLWGQEPEIVNESGNNIYKFYFGNITITLWGDKIFQASVDNGEFCYYIDLEPKLIASPKLG